ncbi:hypothetical protein ACM66B_001228 [Microbotryomycetes sp. NB124-2]
MTSTSAEAGSTRTLTDLTFITSPPTKSATWSSSRSTATGTDSETSANATPSQTPTGAASRVSALSSTALLAIILAAFFL